jgi:hypothetical protein
VASEEDLNLPIDRDAYVAALEVELATNTANERRADIQSELDRVRGGKAVQPKKETR